MRNKVAALAFVAVVIFGGYLAAQYDPTDHNAAKITATNTVTLGNYTNCERFNTDGVGLLICDTDLTLSRDFVNGTFAETFDALITSNGSVVTMTLEQSGGGDLTKQFSSGNTTLDCTSPACSIALTVGSDVSPTENFIYVLESTGNITKSTSDWPATEHIKISYFLVPSAGFVQSDGVYINQNWNDHLSGTNNMGHLTHVTDRSRQDGAYYFSGIAGNGTDGYLTPTAGNVELKSTAGIIYQMHRHTVPAFDTSGTDVVLVVNWNGDAYHNITNLYDIVDDSTGTTIGNNKYFNLVIWGVGNKSGEYAPMMVNVPGGFYNSQSGAENDTSGYDDFSMPAAFNRESSTGFLIARITIQMKTGGGTWIVVSTQDLRGQTSAVAGGGTTSALTDFPDNAFTIFDDGDVTKILAFQASGITAGNTRTVTIQDASGTMAYSADLHSPVTPGGSTTQLQYNNSGSFDGADFTIVNEATDVLELVDGTLTLSGSGNDWTMKTYSSISESNAPYPTTFKQSGTTYLTLDPNSGAAGAVVNNKPFNAVAGGTFAGGVTFSPANATASTTQSQGQGQQIKQVVNVTVVANDNDVVTLMDAFEAGFQVIVNSDAAQILQVFPKSGDDLGNGTNNSTTVAAGDVLECWSTDSNTMWCHTWTAI